LATFPTDVAWLAGMTESIFWSVMISWEPIRSG